MTLPRYFHSTLLSFMIALCLSQNVLALDPNYIVAYGGPDTPGRLYDPNTNSTTFSYTVIGQGASEDDYLNLRLKAFKLEVGVCAPPLTITDYSPDLPENDSPFFFAGPNPDLLEPINDPTDFNFVGLLWKGWHGNGALPVLINPDDQRTFSVTYAGNLEVGPISAGTALISNTTGEFEPTTYTVPGGACASVCKNRQTFHFNDLTPGDFLLTQYQERGLTVSAVNGAVGQLDAAGIFNSGNPLATEQDLGTPNEFYGGAGKPIQNAIDGTGIGNMTAQQNVLILPRCGDIDEQDALRAPSLESDTFNCGAGTGSMTFSFTSPASVVSLSFLDVEQIGTRIVGSLNGAEVYSKEVSPVGNNSFQVVPLTQFNEPVDKVTVILNGPAAIDDLVVCLDEPEIATPTPTPTPPQCDVRSIKSQQARIDGNARSQSIRLRKLAKRLRRNANSKEQRKFARGVIQQAKAIYLSAWQTIWSIKSEYTECEGANQTCVTTNDYGVAASTYAELSSRFVSLASEVVQLLQQARGGFLRPRDIALQKSIIFLDEDNLSQVNTIPASTIACPEFSE